MNQNYNSTTYTGVIIEELLVFEKEVERRKKS